jgi:hypothetical protein
MGRKDLVLGKTPGGVTIMITEAVMQRLVDAGMCDDESEFKRWLGEFMLAIDAQKKVSRGEQLTPKEAEMIGRIEDLEDDDPVTRVAQVLYSMSGDDDV